MLRAAFTLPAASEGIMPLLIDPDQKVAAKYFEQINERINYMQKSFEGNEIEILEKEAEIALREEEQLKKSSLKDKP